MKKLPSIIIFSMNEFQLKGLIDTILNDRYKLSGKVMPALRDWMIKTVGIDITKTNTPQVYSIFL